MKAEIITIGDEILIGQIVDTNSAWMAEHLNQIGIKINRVLSIADDREEIESTIKESMSRVEVVLITGGLGPTRDDITKHTLAKLFNTKLVMNQEVLKHVETLLGSRGIKIIQSNRDQALVPENCQVLFNNEGTAPGMWFEKEGKVVVSMPGVPFEMETIMTDGVLPRLKKMNNSTAIVHRTVLTQGIAESLLADKISQWEDNLPSYIKLAYLPGPMVIRLRLSAYGSDSEKMSKEVDRQIEQLLKLIPNYFFGYDGDTLASVVGEILVRKNAKLAVAESCTGGYLAHLITEVPGSSDWFNGGVVTYSNEIKERLLNVDAEALDQYSAVSLEVVESMVRGAMEKFGTDYAIATSGIAGPSGGTPEKPVGTVWIAIGNKEEIVARKFSFGKDRGRTIIRASQTGLNMLRNFLLK